MGKSAYQVDGKKKEKGVTSSRYGNLITLNWAMGEAGEGSGKEGGK